MFDFLIYLLLILNYRLFENNLLNLVFSKQLGYEAMERIYLTQHGDKRRAVEQSCNETSGSSNARNVWTPGFWRRNLFCVVGLLERLFSLTFLLRFFRVCFYRFCPSNLPVFHFCKFVFTFRHSRHTFRVPVTYSRRTWIRIETKLH